MSAERVITLVSLDQGGDEIAARVSLAITDDPVEVALHVDERLLDLRQVTLDLDTERLAEVVGPVRDLRPVLLRQPEQDTDDPSGIGLGELTDELH